MTKHAALALPGVLLLALFFALPVVAVAVDALSEGGAAFARVFATAGFWRAAGGSAVLTFFAASLSTMIGIGVALHLSRLSPRRRSEGEYEKCPHVPNRLTKLGRLFRP